jgi:cytosine/uracil/thiamine/allantoin permease
MFAFTLPESLGQLALWIAVPVCMVFVGFLIYALCYGARAIAGKDDVPESEEQE